MIKLPNKLYSYNESVLSHFTIIIDELKKTDASPASLYALVERKFTDINEFIDVLLCLFALDVVILQDDILKLKENA